MIPQHKHQQGPFFRPGISTMYYVKFGVGGREVPALLLKELEVDFEDGFEETHICALVETDLVFP
jgi:hypothetical protein